MGKYTAGIQLCIYYMQAGISWGRECVSGSNYLAWIPVSAYSINILGQLLSLHTYYLKFHSIMREVNLVFFKVLIKKEIALNDMYTLKNYKIFNPQNDRH